VRGSLEIQDAKIRQRSDSIGRTVLQTVAENDALDTQHLLNVYCDRKIVSPAKTNISLSSAIRAPCLNGGLRHSSLRSVSVSALQSSVPSVSVLSYSLTNLSSNPLEQVKAKFHYASWFGAMEFGFNGAKGHYITIRPHTKACFDCLLSY